MTLARANEYFDGWADNPPTYILVKSLVEAFGGKAETPQISDRDISELGRLAGPMLPIIHGRDEEIERMAPVFDFEEMKRRNDMKKLGKLRHG